jgi:type II secretory pathway pseudopilin PulG
MRLPLQSKIKNQNSKIRVTAFTLVEMLATVAALVILLGLMVSLARDVRRRSATELTNELLARLDNLMDQYATKNAGQFPPVTPIVESTSLIEEEPIRINAWKNNQDFVKALRTVSISGLPSAEDGSSYVLDAWGCPIVFMPKMHPGIGMAPGDKYFFFSAGPDRKYLSREDNLYSYDRTRPAP